MDNTYFNDFFEVSTHVTMSGIKLKDQYNVLKSMIDKGKKLAVITNGSGDSFFAGLLYGEINGYSIKKSLQVATIVAGLTINSTELFNQKLSSELVEKAYQKYFSEG